MAAYGWRIPFLLGAVFGLVALIMRSRMEESELFKSEAAAHDAVVPGHHAPARGGLFTDLARHWRQALQVIGLTVGLTVAYYVWGVSTPAYAINVLGIDPAGALWAGIAVSFAGGASGRGRGERSGTGERSGSGEPRRERKPRRAAGAEDTAPVQANATDASAAPASAAPQASNTAPATPAAEGERPARKRRRRRRGQRIEGAETASRDQQPGQGANSGTKAKGADGETARPRRPTQHKPARRPEGAATESPSLLSRIGRGLKSLVTRAPRSNH